jgi:hypothetical protein
MRVRIVWRRAIHPDRRLARLIRVLLSARKAPGYQRGLNVAGFVSADEIDRVLSIEDALGGLPWLSRDDYLSGVCRLSNPWAPEPAPNRFASPLQPIPRTAVIPPRSPWMVPFASQGRVRVFVEEDIPFLGRFSPEAIAAPSSMLVSLAQLVESGVVFVPPLEYCVVAFTVLGEEPLSVAGRDLLWQVFQVPVFEQYLGGDGRLLAAECQAHEGWHVHEPNAVFEMDHDRVLVTSLTDLRRPAVRIETGLRGQLVRGVCGCGETSQRLLDPRQVWPASARPAVAS